jgi:hypothetical protein
MAAELPSFDELVDLLRERLGHADALKPNETHSFKELMSDHADVIADGFYSDAYDELAAQGHLQLRGSGKTFGGDAHGRLSADGRLYLRSASQD